MLLQSLRTPSLFTRLARTNTSTSTSLRAFSTSVSLHQKLRIGYIPEHFLTPLHFAHDKYGLSEHVELISYPSGTGTLIDAFHAQDIDVGIGLTEAWIVGLTKTFGGQDWSDKPYHLVGAYTLSPLTWAISTGALREDITMLEELKGSKVGVSRLGSGSQVMASVLAQTHGWTGGMNAKELEYVECGPFEKLRAAVKEGSATFFMWEHFTTKKYWDNNELKRLGEIQTPWPAWHIAARGAYADERIARTLLPSLQKGIQHFENNREEAIAYITEHMDYSREDADTWYDTVRFAGRKEMGTLESEMISNAVRILEKAEATGDRRILDQAALQAIDAERYIVPESDDYNMESAAEWRG